MGVKSQIVKDIQSQVFNEIPELLEYDLWNNQLINERSEQVYNRPALFLEFVDFDLDELYSVPAGTFNTPPQRGLQTIVLHVIIERYRNNVLDFINIVDPLVDKIVFKMHQMSSSDTSGQLSWDRFTRKGEVQDINHDNVMDWQVMFMGTVTDSGTISDTTDPNESEHTITICPTIDMIVDNPDIGTGKLP